MLLDYEEVGVGVHTPVSFVTSTVCLGLGDEGNLGACKILTRPSGTCEDRQCGGTLVGPVAAMTHVCRSCGCNAHNAICNRHGARAPPVSRDFSEFISEFERMEEELAATYHMHLEAYGSNWIERWPQSKRDAIHASVAIDPIEPDKVKCMVKREVGPKVPSKARCIQFYPNLATQAEFAPETASLQKAICGTFYRREFGLAKITFSSGLNAATLGQWAEDALKDYDNPYFYERDGKNWDATMGEVHHRLKMRVYKMAGDEYVRFMDKSSIVKGFGVFQNEVMRYKLHFTTKSGHNDTTLGNNIVNAAITWSCFLGRRVDILVGGDDLFVIVEGDFDEHEIARKEREYGIKPEYRKFRSIEDSSYISGLFAVTDQGIKFIAKPGRLLSCLFWTVKPPSTRPDKLRAYQRGVAKGVLPTMQDVPVVGPWLRNIGDEGDTIKDRSRRCYTYGIEVHADFKPWFDRRYGLSKSDVDEANELLAKAGASRCIVRCHALDVIKAVDYADIEDREEGGDY